MVTNVTIWHGSDADLGLLRRAVGRYCDCVPGETTCVAHDMLTDQTVLDHLVFVGQNRARYVDSEFDITAEWW